MVVITGCSQVIYPEDYAAVEKLCETNGGVKRVFVGIMSYDVECNNKAMFSHIFPVRDQQM